MATTIANKPIGSVFTVRSLLFLLLLNGAPAYGKINEYVLEIINGFRSVVSPPASDMRYMESSEDFRKEANELASKCELALPKSGVVYFTSKEYTSSLFRRLVETFHQGIQAVRDGRCKSSETHYLCRFYRDLMEAGADRIGCGDVAKCPKLGWLYYCVTNAWSSNEPFTDLVYTKGTPCQMCPKSAGYCYHNLCVSHAARTAIQTTTPSAVITCDAPCVNCGERTDAENSCFCQCPREYNSEVDCSKGSGGLPCSACHLAGTPCRNGGREVGGPSGHCRCLCDSDYGGQFCEMPVAQIVGGVVARITNDRVVFYLDLMDRLPAILNNGMADEINLFCRKNQASYLECCGSGTLPTNGSIDFVDASSVHVTCFPTAESPLKNGICTIYATAKGNNGLCRKRTSIPAPILAVPPSVVEKVFNSRYAHKKMLPDIVIGTVTNSYADYFNVSMPTINYISLKVG